MGVLRDHPGAEGDMRFSASIAPAARRLFASVGRCRLSAAVAAALVWALAFAATGNVAHAAQTVQSSGLAAQIAMLEREVDRLEGARAVKRLQRAWGYYVDRALWNEAADLFAGDASIELGADGIYFGRARILQYLQHLAGGGVGLPWGRLSEHYQLQPVVDVAADGLSAKARWRDFALLGEFKKDAAWADGIYENEYVKRDGVWMIKSMHLYVTFVAPFEKGWARLQGAAQTFNFAGAPDESSEDGRSAASKAFPPDRTSTQAYKRFPESVVVPFHYAHPGASRSRNRQAGGADGHLDPRLAAYEHQIELLRDYDAVESLQGMYGYYFDNDQWDEVAQLFTSGATFESGQGGVYVGREHIRRQLALFGPTGPQRGWMNNYLQLQPVIHVAADGRSAKARWESVVRLSRPNTSGEWGLGVYENEYVNEAGTWKISKLHFYTTAFADYDRMWDKGPIPLQGPSAVLPPDRPPTEVYRSLPGVYIPPFHYVHPVTGQPIVTDPQPADSVIRPR
jgi:hypothetical protein